MFFPMISAMISTMSSNKPKGTHPTRTERVQSRHGEGHLVDAGQVTVSGNALSMQIKLNDAPVPGRQFTADAANAKIDHGLVRLLFAQTEPIGDGLLSLLVVQMSLESTEQWIAQFNQEFYENLKKLPDYAKDGDITKFTEPAKQTVILVASYALMGYSGGNGCLDFYYSSPFAINQMAALRKLAIDPVVRVNIQTGVLLALIDQLKEMAMLFPKISGELT